MPDERLEIKAEEVATRLGLGAPVALRGFKGVLLASPVPRFSRTPGAVARALNSRPVDIAALRASAMGACQLWYARIQTIFNKVRLCTTVRATLTD